jgi:hypothetical protein
MVADSSQKKEKAVKRIRKTVSKGERFRGVDASLVAKPSRK